MHEYKFYKIDSWS